MISIINTLTLGVWIMYLLIMIVHMIVYMKWSASNIMKEINSNKRNINLDKSLHHIRWEMHL